MGGRRAGEVERLEAASPLLAADGARCWGVCRAEVL